MDALLALDFLLRSIAGALVLIVLWRGATHAARRMTPANDPGLRLFAAMLIAATTVVATGMLLGLFGALGEIAWGATLVAAGLLLPRVPWSAASDSEVAPPPPPPPSTGFWCAALAFTLGRLLFALRNPPADWDSLHYHMPMVAHWIITGTTGAPLRDPAPFGAYFPGASELLQAFMAFVLHRETLMTWPAIAALPVLALVVRRLALRLGARVAPAEISALALIATDCVLRLTLGTRIDVHLALWAALTALLLVESLQARSAQTLALALLAGGLFAGTKANAPFLFVLLLGVSAAGRFATVRELLSRQRASLVAALFVGGYWYARNLWITGNPLFPAPISLGPLHLPGIENGIDLKRTTQIAVWMEGFGGHLTGQRLMLNFGVAVPLLALAGMLAAARFARRSRRTEAESNLLRIGVFSVLSFALFLISPFSGACAQARPGELPLLNLDNLRLLLPTLVAAVAAGAALLPRGAAGLALLVFIVATTLPPLRAFVGHLVPGLVAASVMVLAARRWGGVFSRHAVAGVLIFAGGAGLLASYVEPARERISDVIWDGYLQREDNLTAAEVRRVREASAGAPFAVTGMNAWAAYYGRDFSGRPHYVPPDRTWRQASSPWSFAPSEGPADRVRWLASLEEGGIACVVVRVNPADLARTPEWAWCLGDRRRFEPLAGDRLDRAWRVRRP